MKVHSAIEAAIAACGSQKELAKLIGVSHQTVWAWKCRGKVSADHCPAIEQATDGAVTCEQLRPDVAWSYLRGTAKAA